MRKFAGFKHPSLFFHTVSESIMTLTPGANVIELCPSSLTTRENKLERLSIANFSSLI